MIFEDYAVPGGTFRENLLRQPGQKHLREDHYGSRFNYDAGLEPIADGMKKFEVTSNGH